MVACRAAAAVAFCFDLRARTRDVRGVVEPLWTELVLDREGLSGPSLVQLLGSNPAGSVSGPGAVSSWLGRAAAVTAVCSSDECAAVSTAGAVIGAALGDQPSGSVLVPAADDTELPRVDRGVALLLGL